MWMSLKNVTADKRNQTQIKCMYAFIWSSRVGNLIGGARSQNVIVSAVDDKMGEKTEHACVGYPRNTLHLNLYGGYTDI